MARSDLEVGSHYWQEWTIALHGQIAGNRLAQFETKQNFLCELKRADLAAFSASSGIDKVSRGKFLMQVDRQQQRQRAWNSSTAAAASKRAKER